MMKNRISAIKALTVKGLNAHPARRATTLLSALGVQGSEASADSDGICTLTAGPGSVAESLESLLDVGAQLGIVGLDAGIIAGDELAVRADQELGEVPAHGARPA